MPIALTGIKYAGLIGSLANFMAKNKLNPYETGRWVAWAFAMMLVCVPIGVFQTTSHDDAPSFPMFFYGIQIAMLSAILINEKIHNPNQKLRRWDRQAGAYPEFFVRLLEDRWAHY